MDNRFFERPILNSPYEYPKRHWELMKVYQIEADFEAKVAGEFKKMIDNTLYRQP